MIPPDATDPLIRACEVWTIETPGGKPILRLLTSDGRVLDFSLNLVAQLGAMARQIIADEGLE